MKQMALSAGSFDRHGKTTRRAAFLAEMERVVPWSVLDETTVCEFRHLLEQHGMEQRLFEEAGRGTLMLRISASRSSFAIEARGIAGAAAAHVLWKMRYCFSTSSRAMRKPSGPSIFHTTPPW